MDSTSSFTTVKQDYFDTQQQLLVGSTCECYLVRLHGKLHFLKRLKSDLRTNPLYAASLQKEFETGYQLDHPHLVRYVARTDDGLLMDYIDGETLDQFVKHHPDYFRNRHHADRFLQQLLSVVGYLHNHQVVHLDLKPSNVMISRVGNDVKLIDLGFCYTDSYNDTMGRTDKYAAPEQKDGTNRVDARTDIYAIGCILQALPCAPLYKKVIRRCTAIYPANRYQSIEELEAALGRKRPYWFWTVLVFVALTVMAVGFWWLLQTKTTNTTIPTTETADSVNTSSEVHTPSISSTLPEQPSVPSVEVTTQRPVAKPSAEAPSSVPPTPSVSSTQTEAPAATPPSPKVQLTADDAARLYRLMKDTFDPIYENYLGQYRNIEYNEMNEKERMEYSIQHIAFEEAIMKPFVALRKQYQQQSDKDLIDEQFAKLREYYDLQQFLPSHK